MYKHIKRFFDIIFSLLAIILLSPILIPVIILLLLTGEHEVFYRQDRVGYKNKIFKIWKFATMLKNSPNMGDGDITKRGDPRITRVGKLLRQSKINELPQLINILTGDMSFVGPRPLMKVGFDRYTDDLKSKVYNVIPGLTGIGSIVFRDEELIITQSKLPPQETYRTIILPYKGALEVWYQQHRNFYTDFMILFLTAWYIVFPNSNLVHKVFPSLPKRNID
ncbi:MAG: UDP-N-acetylgalactosamine-undecaprenyl-phosphate N-acetylgalactosaminephosphotransferase [Bacteroidetes bacterium ADurb.BinA245]|jgi:lipopolysaccharide/colanic/teichoic acid biosynthesis glycosyltransferase|nr:MAG: UDP-N-acetylgalactosamine-undecaprenyl-phosphate N-acetylgalactosaminephosphotransferase [Bacteroidetes bacterium ADurb.BinA245]